MNNTTLTVTLPEHHDLSKITLEFEGDKIEAWMDVFRAILIAATFHPDLIKEYITEE
jgi:hypothetical protein